MGIFGRRNKPRQDNLQAVSAIVERILHSAGINVAQSRMTDVEYGWRFRQGSATIEIYATEKEGRHYFQVLAPIMHLPQSGLLPLYRRLLEMNLVATNLTFGVHTDVVYVFHERPIDGMDDQEAHDIISEIAQNADRYDNELVHEFGGRLYQSV
jgi:hypothetical protein